MIDNAFSAKKKNEFIVFEIIGYNGTFAFTISFCRYI